MTYKQSPRYVDQLQQFAQGYNRKHHRTINTRPESVNNETEEDVHVSSFLSQEEMSRKRSRKPFKFKVGDRVRISAVSSIFDREYNQKWSGEIFTISHRILRNDIPVQKFNDYDGEAITRNSTSQNYRTLKDVGEKNNILLSGYIGLLNLTLGLKLML